MVLPPPLQAPVAGSNSSEPAPHGILDVSMYACTVSTSPSGSSVQFSSLFQSALPVPVGVHFSVVGLSVARSVLQQFDSRNVPFASTMPEASPTVVQPFGGATFAQVLVCGS